jgi:transposase InsO family protein
MSEFQRLRRLREPEETPEELGRRIAALYRELSYPSEAKFRAALRKRGIKVSADFVREIVADQGVRQLTAAAPRFTGHVTARKLDARWMADLMDYTAKSIKGSPVYVLILQDVFSRFIFATALKSKTEVGTAFSRIVEETGRKPEELSTDKGSEFMSAGFQARLSNLGIRHRVKIGPQDLATLDRAIGTLRATLSRRTAEGGPWWEELNAAVKSMNNTEHSALFFEEPGDVEDDKNLRFDLQYHNAEMAAENQEQAEKRAARLKKKAKGAFRTLLPPKTGFRRRAGQQNWSEKIHIVAEIQGGNVVDTEGDSYRMSMVLPVSATTNVARASSFAQGGSAKIREKRRIALRPWLRDMMDVIRQAGDNGISLNVFARRMRDKPGFAQALKEQKATAAQAVEVFDEIRSEKSESTTTLFLTADAPIPRAGTLDAFAS